MNIIIKGARTHNLKDIDVEIPRNKLTVLVGVSGSGKSTIAYDIIAAEGQRQFLESIGTYAARIMNRSQKPDVDEIRNLSPVISIDQKRLKGNPRSTVGTATEIYAYLRLLFSRFGSARNLSAGHFSFNNPKGACRRCKGLGLEYSIDPHSVLDYGKSLNEGASRHNLFRPGSRYFNIIKASGRVDMDKPIKELPAYELEFLLHSPRVVLKEMSEGAVQTFAHRGIITALIERAKDNRGQSNYKKKSDGIFWIIKECPECEGGRLNGKALGSKIDGKSIGDLSGMQLDALAAEIGKIRIPGAEELVERISKALGNLIDVDLGYLSLNRGLDTLSGGETQRLKLARELGTDLIEMVYVLDEPTAGLHPKDRRNLIGILKKLRDAGNTVIAVEHDTVVMEAADRLIEIGPGAGRSGGTVVSVGTAKELAADPGSLTGKYLKGESRSRFKDHCRKASGFLEVRGASSHNLKDVDADIPLGVFCAITGVSGSGKSSLVTELLSGFRDRITLIDQKPVTGSPRGNAATYVGAFDPIRKLVAKENGISPSVFSFNSKGACPECKGLGFIEIDMHFMGDARMECEACGGKRYSPEALRYLHKGKDMHEILNMTIAEACEFFQEKEIIGKLKPLEDVGLGYLTLGQSHDTFSGGEAQRLKLASRLGSKGEIFILDEPTAGLHFSDVERLLALLNRMVDGGNSVIVVEHNTEVIRQADWMIDLGPGGGDCGGTIVGAGTPSELSDDPHSVTGKYLKR